MNKNKTTLTDAGILIACTLLAYFPVSFFLFSLKNDSLVQYLPFRYHLSESIQHGYFPFWSPYLYTGFPIHADMQGMTWNPIVLLISVFTRYNMSVLEFEVTVYLILAALGMYRLLKAFNLNRYICLAGAISYMSCGFINGSASVIPWISSAAFIPFVFTALKLLLENPVIKNMILFAAALSLLFVCGYPTFFIYTCYVIAAILVYALVRNRKDLNNYVNRKTFLFLALSALIFILICSPAIISYAEFLPEYSRGSGITAAKAAENPFTPYSSISFFLPNAVHKEHVWLNTDTSMRNSYVGLFVFGLFALSLFYKKNGWQNFILGVTVFTFLLSLGSFTPLHKIVYTILPGFNTFRHPGNLRLFTSMGIILLAAFFIQHLLKKTQADRNRILLNGFYLLAIVLCLPVIYSLLIESGVIRNIIQAVKTGQPKGFLDTLRFPSMLLIQAVLQLFFLAALFVVIKKRLLNKKLLLFLFASNSILFCWIALPFNFISQLKTSEVNNYVASFPDGYPLPDIHESVGSDIISDSTKFPVYGYPNFYSKKISIQDYVITPTLNKSYENFNNDLKLRRLLRGYGFAWLNDTIVTKVPDTINKRFSYGCYTKKDWKDSTTGSLELISFYPGKMIFRASSDQATVLTVFQQANPNWHVTLNSKKTFRLRMNKAFMGVVIPPGESVITFSYRPYRVIFAMWTSISVIILLCVIYMRQSYRRQ